MSAISAIRRQVKELVDGTLRLTCDIAPTDRKAFWELFPEIDAPIALAPLAYGPVEKKEPNTLAQKLHINGYFRNVKLWLAMHDSGLYTLQQHKKNVEGSLCCGNAFWPHQCQGDVVAHHTDQSADMAGGKRQPENPQKGLHYYCAPVCHAMHTYLHTQAPRETKQDIRVYAIQLTAEQMKHGMKHHIGLESLADLTEQQLREFEQEIGL